MLSPMVGVAEGGCLQSSILLLLLPNHSSVSFLLLPDSTALLCIARLRCIAVAGGWVNPLDDIGQSFDGSPEMAPT